jgi:hypothetical protein
MTKKEQFKNLMQDVKNAYEAIAGCLPNGDVYSLINKLRMREIHKDCDIVELARYMAKTKDEPGMGGRATIALRLIVSERIEQRNVNQKLEDSKIADTLCRRVGL